MDRAAGGANAGTASASAPSSPPAQPAPPAQSLAGSRGRAFVVALLAAQFLGYLLIWFALHATKPVSGEELSSAGWYSAGSAYARWFGRLPGAGFVDTPFARHTLLGAGFALSSAAYASCLVLLKRRSIGMKVGAVALAALLLSLPLLLAPQMLSSDLWGYVMYGRVGAVHGGNPMVDPPSIYPHDPLLDRAFWKTSPPVYGPAWIGPCVALARAVYLLGGSASLYALAFKGLALGCHLVNVFLVAAILRRLRPGWEAFGAALYGWNPLALFEFANGGHNDAWMLALLLAGAAMAARGRSNAAVGWMVAAGLAKLMAVVVVPAYSLYVARRSPRPVLTVARHALIGLALAAVFYAAFWRGRDTFVGITHAPNLTVMYRSPASGLSKLLERPLTGGTSGESLRSQPPPDSPRGRLRARVRKGCFLCFVLCWAAFTLRRIETLDDWLDRAVWIFAAYLLFAAYQFNPWYGTWLVALAPLVRRPSLPLLVTPFALFLFYLPLDLGAARMVYFLPLLLLLASGLLRLARRDDRTRAAGKPSVQFP